MTDNIYVRPATESNRLKVATDEAGEAGAKVHYPLYKQTFGPDGLIPKSVEETNPLPVDPQLEKTAFGELAIAELSPTIQIQFPYSINPELLHDRSNGGTATIENSMAKLSTGAGANQSGQINTVESIQYHPGQGTLNRFTALYTAGVTGSQQLAGIGNSSDGFFFGYNGADFGILLKTGGVPEVRTLTITTASTTIENVTITLDGDAKADVAVTDSGVISTTAHEIAEADYSNVGRGWTAHSEGDGTVVFKSYDSSPRTGTYSLSVATTAAGAFAQSLAGVSPTDTWTTQTAWNLDKADGTGRLPVIDFTKGNVFEIRYQWLGFGPVYFYIEHPVDGKYIPVHTIQYANANTVPSISNPTLPLCLAAINTTNTTDIVLMSGSIAAFVEGKVDNTHFHRGHTTVYTGIGTTETPVLTLHNKEIFQGKENRIKSKMILIILTADSTKQSIIRIRKGVKLAGAVYADIETPVSVMEYDESATAQVNGSDQLGSGVAAAAPIVLDLEDKSYNLDPGESFTVSVQAPVSTVDGVISVNWEELH